MKFTAFSLLEEGAIDALSSDPDKIKMVPVDIRNATATVANLKATLTIKLKIKEPNTARLVAAVAGRSVSDPSSSPEISAVVLDESDASKALTLSAAGLVDGVKIYATRSKDISEDLFATLVSLTDPSIFTVALTSAAAAAPAAENTASPPSSAAMKRTREDGAETPSAETTTSYGIAPRVESGIRAPPAPAPFVLPQGLPFRPIVASAEGGFRVVPEGGGTAEGNNASQPANGGVVAEDDEAVDAEGEEIEDDDDDADWEEIDGDEELEEIDEDDEDGEGWDIGGVEDVVLQLTADQREMLQLMSQLPDGPALFERFSTDPSQVLSELQTTQPRLFTLISQNHDTFLEVLELLFIIQNIDDQVVPVTSGTAGGEGAASNPTERMSQQLLAMLANSVLDDGTEQEADEAEGIPQLNDGHDVDAYAGGASENRPLSDEDEAKVLQLMELGGFERNKCISAYLRNGRNVERAANFLFENM